MALTFKQWLVTSAVAHIVSEWCSAKLDSNGDAVSVLPDGELCEKLIYSASNSVFANSEHMECSEWRLVA